jgi:F-type H+-transporting ATPase subunit b
VAVLLQMFAFKPIIRILEERRHRIDESLKNAEKIKQQLAEADAKYEEMLVKANQDAQRIIDEAKASSLALAEKRQQQAIADAEQIVAKAREAATLDRDRMMAELRREVGRLVVETTAKVAGKVLTADDQKRLTEEAARQIAA